MRVGFIGWRGMVGSVLLERMREEGDFEGLDASFYSTSQVGQKAPLEEARGQELFDAFDIGTLSRQDVVVTCQGGGYTEEVHSRLRDAGWNGYWIDAASTLRLDDGAVVVLDPVNREQIERALDSGVRTLVGGNCTVSLMLMALAPLIRNGWVEWMTSMTYQAASGAGAQAMRELADQTRRLGVELAATLDDPRASALELDGLTLALQRDRDLSTEALGAPLIGNPLPWIDRAMETGQTREEWKAQVESQRILGLERPVPIDGVCVRVSSMRCHAQALTIKLTRDVPLEEIEAAVAGSHEWIELVPNEREATLARLSPAAVGGTLRIAVGRLRKMILGPDYLAAYTVGDQLLWGAAEPLRRALAMVRERDAGAAGEKATDAVVAGAVS